MAAKLPPIASLEPVHTFDLTALNGKDEWVVCKFSKYVYDVWMPSHLKRMCTVIEQMPPDLNLDVSQGSDLQSTEALGLSQEWISLSVYEELRVRA